MPDVSPYKMSDKKLAEGAWKGIPCFLAESELLLHAADQNRLELLSMLSTPEFPFPNIDCKEKVVVSKEEFEAITGYEQTRSVVGICRRPQEPDLESLLEYSKRIIVVEDSTNGANMATIFRIACSFGIDAVLVSHSCADPLFRRSARMSRGDVLRIPWSRVGKTRQWAREIVPVLHEKGYVVASLALSDESISLADLPKPDKLALVMGTEGEGLQEETVNLSDLVVKIPMREGVDSLNVAAAAALAAWQATR